MNYKRLLVGLPLMFGIIITLFACGNTKQKYTVTWKNYDGTILETDTDVEKDTVPSYDRETPVRLENANYTYTFNNWSPLPTKVVADITYTATYTSYPKDEVTTYIVAWYNGEVKLKQYIVNEGAKSTYDGAVPTKTDEFYDYSFEGWGLTDGGVLAFSGNESPLIFANANFYAIFSETLKPLILKNGTYTITEIQYDDYVLNDLELLFELMWWDEITIDINDNELSHYGFTFEITNFDISTGVITSPDFTNWWGWGNSVMIYSLNTITISEEYEFDDEHYIDIVTFTLDAEKPLLERLPMGDFGLEKITTSETIAGVSAGEYDVNSGEDFGILLDYLNPINIVEIDHKDWYYGWNTIPLEIHWFDWYGNLYMSQYVFIDNENVYVRDFELDIIIYNASTMTLTWVTTIDDIEVTYTFERIPSPVIESGTWELIEYYNGDHYSTYGDEFD
ncbi:MAG: hypothetical protein LBM99_01920, partial [Bacillales bacterium]|nr:hypothetical protein [Bacillales bacterium]